MPELPEVETIVRGLHHKIPGLKIKSLEVNIPKWGRTLRQDGLNPDKHLVGHKVKGLRRRAKLVLLDLDNDKTVLFHLKLTGQLVFENSKHQITPGGHPIPSFNSPQPNRATHAIFTFDNDSHLYFNDSRMFGFMRLVPTNKIDELPFVKAYGPEPLGSEFTEKVFEERLKRRPRMKIKVLLLDQTFVAGIGNIYANEALWESGVHPLRLVGSLTSEEIKKLYRAIRHVLEVGIANRGTTLSDFVDAEGNKGSHQSFLKAHNQDGEKCQKDDGGEIKRIVVGGRGTFFCPAHQKI
jgi:formamidopyrimidine-DNA glycosylase